MNLGIQSRIAAAIFVDLAENESFSTSGAKYNISHRWC